MVPGDKKRYFSENSDEVFRDKKGSFTEEPFIIREENWGISAERIRHFFTKQPNVCEKEDAFQYHSCKITLEPTTSMIMGKWPMQRTRIRFEGPEEELEKIYRKFFLEFLSAGG